MLITATSTLVAGHKYPFKREQRSLGVAVVFFCAFITMRHILIEVTLIFPQQF